MEPSVRDTFELENPAGAQHVVARPSGVEFGRGYSRLWGRAWAGAPLGLALCVASGVWLDVSEPRSSIHALSLQPTAAKVAIAQPTRTRPGLASELFGKAESDKGSGARAQRAERLKARREAARAKREAAREQHASAAQARREAAQERREAAKAKREAARERRAANMQERREAASAKRANREAAKGDNESARERNATAMQERREAAKAKREAARERYAAAVQARREAAEARREAVREKHEAAKERREAASSPSLERQPERQAAPESKPFGGSANAVASAAPAPQGNTGLLRINSLPWSQVFVDGRMVGNTPQRNISLAPGEHDVRLVNSTFAMSKTFRVRVTAGQQVTRGEMLEE